MARIFRRLWKDERGEVTYVSVILIYTLLGIGAIVGLICVRNQIVQEFGDLSIALDQLNQSYSVDFESDCPDYFFVDEPDLGAYDFDFPNEGDPDGQPPADISVTEPSPDPNTTPGENSP